MRFHRPLDDLFGNPVRLRVLRVLARSPGVGYTGRELARLCNASPSQAILSLSKLEESGVVRRQLAGRAHLWRLTTEHILSERLIKLFADEAGVLGQLRSELGAALHDLPVSEASVFGSIARADEGPSSDIDLFLRVATAREKERVADEIALRTTTFAVRFGNPVSSLVLDDSQVRQPANPRLLQEIRRDGIPVERDA
jgi:predicted nucleotidyltransferase